MISFLTSFLFSFASILKCYVVINSLLFGFQNSLNGLSYMPIDLTDENLLFYGFWLISILWLLTLMLFVSFWVSGQMNSIWAHVKIVYFMRYDFGFMIWSLVWMWLWHWICVKGNWGREVGWCLIHNCIATLNLYMTCMHLWTTIIYFVDIYIWFSFGYFDCIP